MGKPLIIEYCKTPLGVVFMAAEECDWETVENNHTGIDPDLFLYPQANTVNDWELTRSAILIHDTSVVFREVPR